MASSSIVLEACNGSKKRIQKIFNFETFCIDNSKLKGPFRESINLFLKEFAVIQSYEVVNMPVWSILFITNPNGVVFPLYAIEETVEHSANPFCDHCKFAGWGHHFVSKRRYHLIIPVNANWERPLKANFAKLKSHLLHGLIHCNGYGHLVSINGDSNFLTNIDLMDFWDRLCTMLKTRKISVRDVLKEDEIELRLVNGVAYGRSWFGKWGYKFSRGSYGVSEEEYDTAVQFLSSLDLDRIVSEFKNRQKGRKIEKIIDKYRDVSVEPLFTMSNLLQFMLGDVKFIPPRTIGTVESTTFDKFWGRDSECGITMGEFVSRLVNNGCRWSARRLENVLKLIVELLKENKENGDGNCGMSRQDLRDGTRKRIGDTGLIDFVLKSIRCFATGNLIVRRMNNPVTNRLEFTIDEAVTEKAEQDFLKFRVSHCRRSEERLSTSSQMINSIIKGNVNGKSAMSWKELQNKTTECIGDTELSEFAMKSMGDYLIGNEVVSRSIYPAAKRVKFSIQDSINLGTDDKTEISLCVSNVAEDLLFLYKNVLLGYSPSNTVSFASRVVLDSKQFAKEWIFEEQIKEHQQLMALTCQVLPSFDELETELTRPLSPGEVVHVPDNITIKQLKMIAQCALRSTYCIMDNFVVKQIGGLRAIADESMLSCTVEPGSHVWVRGSGLDLYTRLRYEGGEPERKVDCVCQTNDHDGERFVVCYLCHVQQHTRCIGINDEEIAPSVFLCAYCADKLET